MIAATSGGRATGTGSGPATEFGGRVDPPARDLAVLAASVNELLDAMSNRQLEAQRVSDAMNAERAAAAAAQVAREISAVADQTRLLALNAAIEAPRSSDTAGPVGAEHFRYRRPLIDNGRDRRPAPRRT